MLGIEFAHEQNPMNGVVAASEAGEIQAGCCVAIGGTHQQGDGVNFVLFSRHAGLPDFLYQ
jgi:hypothetical protein